MNILTKFLPSFKYSRISAAILAAAVLCGSSFLLYTVAEQRKHDAQVRQATVTSAKQMERQKREAIGKKAAQEKAAKTIRSSEAAKPAAANPVPVAAASPQPKYAVSSDPRSTAYSLTPPQPNPASFTTQITRSGQVAAGTLISYNATKGEKSYYGGDLVLSTSSVTISRSNPSLNSTNVTVSSPDGAVIGMPSLPWNEPSQYFAIAMDSSKYKPEGNSFDMLVSVFGAPPVGVMQLHITSGRTAQTADGWQYDGFITINVVE